MINLFGLNDSFEYNLSSSLGRYPNFLSSGQAKSKTLFLLSGFSQKNFIYTSDKNKDWLSIDAFKLWLSKYIKSKKL